MGKSCGPNHSYACTSFVCFPSLRSSKSMKKPSLKADEFSPNLFNRGILRRFSALTSVQGLWIDYLSIFKFMPRIRRYFGHFLPTARSLALTTPKGTHRQIIYLIGLFQHLEDLKLYDQFDSQDEPKDDLALTPSSAPLLRGPLTMTCFTRVELLKDVIVLFKGVRFHHMDLCNVNGMRLLLGTCAKTLETLRLYPTNPRGKRVSGRWQALTNAFTAGSSLRDFDSSRNKSLQILEIPVSFILCGDPGFLAYVLSTITFNMSLEVVIVYLDYNKGRLTAPQAIRSVSRDAQSTGFSAFVARRRLGWYRRRYVGDLKQVVAEERRKGGLTTSSPNR